MQEFSSISVSSYEAGALAERLTEQSSDGWSVVAIVPTGSTVTAYLSRGAGGSTADHATAAATPVPAIDHDSRSGDGAAAPSDGDDDSPAIHSGAPAHDEQSSSSAYSPTSDPVTEAPGWASGSSTTATHGSAAAPETPADSSSTGAGASAAASTASSTESAAPAGWYADPSSRFELRYWDGSQWTEHVSRGGQQFTDPPIA